MDPPTSDKKQKKVPAKITGFFNKLRHSPAKLAGLPKSLAVEVEPSLMLEPRPAGQRSQINVTNLKSSGQTQGSRTPESTWDRASELLRQRRRDLYDDLEELRAAKGFQDNSDELQKLLAGYKDVRDDAHKRSLMNVQKVLRSILVYKDVAIAVSRLDPHGIAPMVLTGVCVVAQVCPTS